jgi:hypothetical protein
LSHFLLSCYILSRYSRVPPSPFPNLFFYIPCNNSSKFLCFAWYLTLPPPFSFALWFYFRPQFRSELSKPIKFLLGFGKTAGSNLCKERDYSDTSLNVLIPCGKVRDISLNYVFFSQHSLQIIIHYYSHLTTWYLVAGNIINPLKTKRKLLYLKTHSVPHCKHFSSRL